ncbi:MAG: sigma-70 family RNA polymerase sigma factor [Planctomycetes bacterium]|nr:sigma-70 family RNA polymerase sigma factor [Planctomycetota bacterium]
MVQGNRSVRDEEARSFLLRLLASLGVPSQDQEDLAHQAFLRSWRRGYLSADLDRGRQRALLARVGYSTWVDELRKRRPMLDLGAVSHEPWEAPPLDTVQRVRELIECAGLGEDDIELLEQRFGRGKSCAALSRELGLHVNTVRRRLERVLDQLRRSHHSDERRSTASPWSLSS